MATGSPQVLPISEGGTGSKTVVAAKSALGIQGLSTTADTANFQLNIEDLTTDRIQYPVNADGGIPLAVIKATTGDGTARENLIQWNSADNTLKLYIGGAWRNITFT